MLEVNGVVFTTYIAGGSEQGGVKSGPSCVGPVSVRGGRSRMEEEARAIGGVETGGYGKRVAVRWAIWASRRGGRGSYFTCAPAAGCELQLRFASYHCAS